ncbi:MAG TPA: putative glycoside hydrolase [Gallionellaceae bacterium]
MSPQAGTLHHIRRAARFARWVVVLFPAVVSCSSSPGTVAVQIVDSDSNAPIAGAVVIASGQIMRTDGQGMVSVARQTERLSVRALGHGRLEVERSEVGPDRLLVQLPKVTPKALYLSLFGVADTRLRENALKLIGETELNALVIEVKDDRGHIAFPSAAPLAAEIGAQKVITVRDMAGLLALLHAQGIYTVARISTFKDNLLARSRPKWAVHTRDGNLWLNRDGMGWSDPFRREVWDYNIGIAVEAARLGFDEIQFDYLRFPDTPEIVLSKNATVRNRVDALAGFLEEARKRLEPYNVFIAVDIFGYVLWNEDDTGIGQRIEDLAPQVDYVSPMLYPSSFQFGIPGFRIPVAHPYETVFLSLINAQRRTSLPSPRFRPWLQAFTDYAYDRRRFGARQIADQIRAAEQFGSDGWMLWNPQNRYTAEGLKKGKKE